MAPPCVVLVINDNPYGLMVALSSVCPYTMLELHSVGFKVDAIKISIILLKQQTIDGEDLSNQILDISAVKMIR